MKLPLGGPAWLRAQASEKEEMAHALPSAMFAAEDKREIQGLRDAADRLEKTEKALELHLQFLASLPKGWLGKTCGDVGLLNDAYLASSAAGFLPKPKKE